MPKASKKDASNDKALETLSFEDALSQLESTVEAMESGDLPLEDLLKKYEEGSKLRLLCQSKLDEAEAKIKRLERHQNGDLAEVSVDIPAETP